MEHLFCDPEEGELQLQAIAIRNTDVLDRGWEDAPPLTHQHTWPIFPWMGFDHDNKPNGQFWSAYKDYPRLRGWDVFRSIDKGSLHLYTHPIFLDSTATDVEKIQTFSMMMQSWTTIGLVEAICEKSVKVSYLTRLPDGVERAFDTRNLTFLLYGEARKIEELQGTERRRRLDSMQTTFSTHYKVFYLLTNPVVNDDNEKHLVDIEKALLHKSLQVARVSALIWEAIRHTFEFDGNFKVKLRKPNLSYDLLGLLHPRLHEAGFCPSLFETDTPLSYTTLEWLIWWGNTSGLPRIEDHGHCTAKSCHLDQVSLQEFGHSFKCQQLDCEPIRGSAEEVYKALDNGAVPLVQLRTAKADGKIDYIVVSTGNLAQTTYYALSHVWRHGLGSTSEQGLLACNLSIIRDCLSIRFPNEEWEGDGRYKFSPRFWIDSLCIPSAEAYRTRAIAHIDMIFRYANEVLVLDKILRQLRERGRVIENELAAITVSAWQTR